MRLNVMLLKRGVFAFGNLFEGHRRGRKLLKTILPYQLKIEYHWNMEYDIDKGIIFLSDEGFVSEVLSRGYAIKSRAELDGMFMTDSQRSMTKGIEFIAGIPIWDYDYDRRHLGNKIVGVLSVDSSSISKDTLTRDRLEESIKGDLQALSMFVSMLI